MFRKLIRAKKPPTEAESASLPAPIAEATWETRLQTALGNDLALLALAKDAPSIDIKLSAVLALASEDALRLAEQEFRTHDRRIHRAVKDRYKTEVERRETRARAGELIQSAETLVEEPAIPANRLVELDHAWRALDASLLEDIQKTRFSELQQCLAQLLRERSEAKRSVSRWIADARQALAHLGINHARLANIAIPPHELITALAAASAAARTTLAALPASANVTTVDSSVIATLDQALRTALQDSAPIEARLMLLDELQRGTQQPEPPQEDGEPATPAAIVATPLQRWQALAPIADPGVEKALNARFEAWQRMLHDAQRKRQTDSRQRGAASDKAAQQARLEALMKAVGSAEEALAAGRLAAALKHMPALDAGSANGATAPALQARIEKLQAEIARLKGWQHWGSEQARDDLVAEAEALARSTIVVDESSPAKLPIQQIEKSIEQLRARWKQLDQMGGANSKALWQRFDGALKIAYVPVAAHFTRLNEARLENLAKRESLLDALDALNIVSDDSGAAPDWKEIARALAHFQMEWRKLGPLQHTVPHKSQAALTERMKSSVARLEQPLHEVQHSAKAQREQFIVRARALSQNAQDRDLIAKVRELQTQWQQHAKSQPLPRAVENAMWADFKAAIGAVMDRREEALNARTAQLEANRAQREALIMRLQAVGQDEAEAEIKRILAEVDSEWHQAGDVPGNQAAKLESKYRDARDKVRQYLANSAQRKWNVTCDALAGKLALCDEIEAITPAAPANIPDIEVRWAALPALPSRWEQALQERFQTGVANVGGESKAPGNTLNDLLLQLEAALDIPSPAAFQAARRSLKLQLMKEALEERRPASPAPADINNLTAAVLACAHHDAEQRQRLEAVIVMLRKSTPGSLGR
ncbi:conserved protein of unknown function [Georgfuchsia toluolica]|uniref:DUF349 domain-containing protein n=1 Tax=Georgfuchsia toluolica TaxID=424218 RepID=A0A916J708_9PROT|nr:DUF349 domain-containing protein [Georgfuchsia toluolica]CAG4884608.1 conserved protein of unknown function [Georgfuchsia toluolica]